MPRFVSILFFAGAIICSAAQSVYNIHQMEMRGSAIEQSQGVSLNHVLPAIVSGSHA